MKPRERIKRLRLYHRHLRSNSRIIEKENYIYVFNLKPEVLVCRYWQGMGLVWLKPWFNSERLDLKTEKIQK